MWFCTTLVRWNQFEFPRYPTPTQQIRRHCVATITFACFSRVRSQIVEWKIIRRHCRARDVSPLGRRVRTQQQKIAPARKASYFIDSRLRKPSKWIREPIAKLITKQLRSEIMAKIASKISMMPETRKNLISIQRSFKSDDGLIADGRDMGTVVFPEAAYKIFLTADPETRAKRRY